MPDRSSLQDLALRCVALAAGFLAFPAPGLQAQTFTPVASPAIAAHISFSTGATWVDADHDGDLDIFVVTGFGGNRNNVFYRNDGGDTFTGVTGVPIVQDNADSPCSTWGDYDNDGDIDAFVSNFFAPGGMLYEGHGGADLTLNTTAGIGGASLTGAGCAWGDYDNDGFIDLVISVINGPTGNWLFHNNGDGTFTQVSAGALTSTIDSHHNPTWSDYDGDGDLDLFFATGPVNSTDTDRMYRNMLDETGTATFQAISTAPIATDARDSQVITWADYDNDGDLDMYAVNYTSVPNQLYRNDGAGVFTKILTGNIVTDTGAAHGITWGDFDNDGDLDVYVARDLHQNNRYYRNNGDGTFTSVTTGAFVTDGLSNYGVTAGDYDGDGDLDLFLPTARSEAPSVLYRNDLGNGSHWLKLRLEGTVSNRSAIGAKVRVRAVIGGSPHWQMREVLAGTGYGGPNALEAHFGLGDAAVADTVRVEWPSGLVTLRTAVPVDQVLSILEDTPSAAPPERPDAGLFLAFGRNPFRESTTVRFRLPEDAPVSLDVLDVGGRLVTTLRRGRFPAGEHAVPLHASSLPGSGVFLVRLTAGAREAVRLVVHVR